MMGDFKEPKPMPWNIFIKRRRIRDVRSWARAMGITDYTSLEAYCRERRIIPPKCDDLSFLQGKNKYREKTNKNRHARVIKTRKKKPRLTHEARQNAMIIATSGSLSAISASPCEDENNVKN